MDSKNGTDYSDAFAMFNWLEYMVFSSMLGLSALIGIYYGFFKKQDTVSEYLLGGKKMAVFPVTMSLVASHVSGITLLGVPSEIYTYGTQYTASIFCVVLSAVFSLYTVLPVFYKLQLRSPFEYFELRFSYGCRMVGSLIFAVYLIFITPMVMYIPALAFNQVTGVKIYVITPIIGLICIFYTSFGGLKAVIWTDTLQGVFTSAALLFVIFIGCSSFGGISEIFKINEEGHRLEIFNMDPSIFRRNTFWTITIGYTFQFLGFIAYHPGVLQRQISVPTYRKAQLVTIYSHIGFIIVKLLCTFVGLLVYAKFHDCDPLASGVIKKSGQLLPYYVMSSAKQYPGITGLFISGVVSSALSTLSAGLNTVTGTIYEDFSFLCLKKKKLSDSKASFVMKMIVLILGIVCLCLVYIVDKFDSILQIVVSVSGISSGALVGMFILGIFFPWANSTGAMVGAATGFVVVGWISFGAQVSLTQKKLKFPGKITSIDNCPFNISALNATSKVQNYTGMGSPVIAADDVSQIYRMSYAYTCMIGVLTVVFVGLLVSFLTKKQDLKTLNADLIVSFMRRFLPRTADLNDEKPEEKVPLRTNIVKFELTPKVMN